MIAGALLAALAAAVGGYLLSRRGGEARPAIRWVSGIHGAPSHSVHELPVVLLTDDAPGGRDFDPPELPLPAL